MRAEAAVREVAVEADRRPEGARHVERDEEDEVDGMEGDTPEQAHGREQPDRRNHHRDEGHDLADRARLRPDGADRYAARRCFVQDWSYCHTRRIASITTGIRCGANTVREDRGHRWRCLRPGGCP